MRFWSNILVLVLPALAVAAGQAQRSVAAHRMDPQFADPGEDAVPIEWSATGHTYLGDWRVETAVLPAEWAPGHALSISSVLEITDEHLAAAKALGFAVDGFCLLVTAERTFDADGWIRLPSDEKMSTLLTPTGLAIEGGYQGAITNRFGQYDYRTPVDIFRTSSLQTAAHFETGWRARFNLRQTLPADLPPGIYRLRLDFGFTVKGRYYSLNGEQFAVRPFFKAEPTQSYAYSQPIRTYGVHVSGRAVDASAIKPRIPWTLLDSYNSNGYYGAVADEDKGRFALSNRFIIPDDVILPRYDSSGKQLSYSLEPHFPTDIIEARANIPWDYQRGDLTIKITNPDGTVTDLGTAPFVGASGQWPTTKRSAFTAWKPPAYGYYTVQLSGHIEDVFGNIYEGGGTYHLWIANRMTLATATFQGQAYPVGGRYGRDIMFNPPLPATVETTATLYVNSDPAKAQTIAYTGTATAAGLYTAAQGLQPLVFTAPGEYRAHVLARYTDSTGNLWVCSMTHAGVVYDPATNLVARGKKLQIGGKYLDRGETHVEGYTTADGTQHLQHINFPFNNGDVLLIASEGQGSNKIEPVLTYDFADKPLAYDTSMQGIGRTNVKLKTSNGLSPHLFPEYITDWQYYYGGAPRPGFMARFLVGENQTRAPYWPTSLNNGGGQIGASSDGDVSGDIYRLIGGVVLRNKGQAPQYAGYLASAFIMPKGSNNNRVVAAGAEDVDGPFNSKARVFFVGTRPGQTYQTGTVFAPAVQIDPVLPANVTFTLQYPDGRQVAASGVGDATGTFVGSKWTLDIPGIYRFFLTGDWQGNQAVMPGMPPEGGFMYVIEANRPADAPELSFNLPPVSTFNPTLGLTLAGKSTAQTVSYAAIMPGAILDEGVLAVHDGRFQYFFSPKSIAERTPTYGMTNRGTGATAMGDVVHITFFSEEIAPDGRKYHSFARILLRGTQVIWAK